MKRKKKYQNQQIFLNQDIYIKFFNNFLTFSALNSFRLKYYYSYMKFIFIFYSYSNYLLYNFWINFYLLKIITNNSINLNFFRSYGSSLLQKFLESRNSFADSLDNVVFSNLSKGGLLSNRQITYFNKDVLVNNTSVHYFWQYNLVAPLEYFIKSKYYNNLEYLLFYAYINKLLYLYKIFIVLSLYIINK